MVHSIDCRIVLLFFITHPTLEAHEYENTLKNKCSFHDVNNIKEVEGKACHGPIRWVGFGMCWANLPVPPMTQPFS